MSMPQKTAAELPPAVFAAITTAIQNAVDYLTVRVFDATLTASEQSRIKDVLSDLRVRNSESCWKLTARLSVAHDLIHDLFVMKSVRDGRVGVGVANDLRKAMDAIVHDNADIVITVTRHQIAPPAGASSAALASLYPGRGSMPSQVVERLYEIRKWEVSRLAEQNVIAPADLVPLDRGARFMVADTLFAKCNEQAREALLNDPHHGVRSTAFLSQTELALPAAPVTSRLAA